MMRRIKFQIYILDIEITSLNLANPIPAHLKTSTISWFTFYNIICHKIQLSTEIFNFKQLFLTMATLGHMKLPTSRRRNIHKFLLAHVIVYAMPVCMCTVCV